MSTTQTLAPLTEQQAIAQVQEWIDAGLPGTFVAAISTVLLPPGIVNVQAGTGEAVDMWAAALGVGTETIHGTDPDDPRGPLYSIVRCCPVILGGWRLNVSLFLPKPMVPPFRIEVA